MKILIAEDHPVSRLLVKKTADRLGHEILEAENGDQAWNIFRDQEPDMIISDWMMPGVDGITLCRNIRSFDRKTYAYVILLTARDRTEDLVAVFDAGADDYMIKPFQPDELRSRIKTGERIVSLERAHHSLQGALIDQNRRLDTALQELKATQAQILQAEKMASIGQLAAGIAHEINNPISFISSNLDALNGYTGDLDRLIRHYQELRDALEKDPAGLAPEIRDRLRSVSEYETRIEISYLQGDIPELLQDCREGARRIGKIVRDLKSFAHPGNDRRMRVDLNKGLESTLNVVYNELKYKADIIREFGQIPAVEGFPQKLNQVFMNILVNAAQAIENKGEIRIRTRQEGKDAVIDISDTGCGIPEENLSRIFDPFFTTKEVGKGTGLGMNIAYNIVREHQGKISVQSEIGKGSTFTVILPGAE